MVEPQARPLSPCCDSTLWQRAGGEAALASLASGLWSNGLRLLVAVAPFACLFGIRSAYASVGKPGNPLRVLHTQEENYSCGILKGFPGFPVIPCQVLLGKAGGIGFPAFPVVPYPAVLGKLGNPLRASLPFPHPIIPKPVACQPCSRTSVDRVRVSGTSRVWSSAR